MAIGVYVHSGSMTTAHYDEIAAELEAAGAGRPAGRISHCTFGPADDLMVFDIWENQETFEEFGKVLIPILAKHGLAGKAPDVMPVHNMIF
jgi:hypothetical protein